MRGRKEDGRTEVPRVTGAEAPWRGWPGAPLAASAPAAAQQGGRAVVSFQVDVSTLDPAIGYDWQNWSIIKSLFAADGLPARQTSSALASYTVPGGRTYTFTLRDVLF